MAKAHADLDVGDDGLGGGGVGARGARSVVAVVVGGGDALGRLFGNIVKQWPRERHEHARARHAQRDTREVYALARFAPITALGTARFPSGQILTAGSEPCSNQGKREPTLS